MATTSGARFDRSLVVLVFAAGKGASTTILPLSKLDPKSPRELVDKLKRRDRHQEEATTTTCVACYGTSVAATACRKCAATTCVECEARIARILGGRCPLCRG